MQKKALTSLTVLFFMMGFITCLNDILVPYLKAVFQLDYAQAALVQFCFFGAYGLTSIPASKIIEKLGYHHGMVLGFMVTAVGCLLFYPAVSLHTYGLFLFALFILASGVVLLQVAANPYVSVIGPKETASSRLTMVQAFNSFGTFLAPFFGAYFILSKLDQTSNAEGVKYPYLIIAVVLVVIALLLSRLKLPEIKSEESKTASSWRKVLKEPGVLLGMIGIFTYVGAEVAIGTFLINYIVETTTTSETQAAGLVAIYWGCAMVGRFLGIFTLKKFSPGRVLMVHAMAAIGLILISINSRGNISVYSMILIGLCNSIMFPTIFTLAIKGLAPNETSKGSGLLATAILGGALVPVLTGQIADLAGLRTAFLLPTLCYGYIAFMGLRNR
ncbi:MAG: sugar MFS transporter [Bacteriovoracaceae bacterium]|nr:sugar MFS transporter [Bacteriovoracaceae bacterium]